MCCICTGFSGSYSLTSLFQTHLHCSAGYITYGNGFLGSGYRACLVGNGDLLVMGCKDEGGSGSGWGIGE